MAVLPNRRLSGAMICRLMRRHRVTIRALASRYQLTQKRVREVRTRGVEGFAASEWHFLICGRWLDTPAGKDPTGAAQ